MFDPKIFRAYDIRGVWGRDFDAQFAQTLASKLAAYWSTGTIIVGRDGRPSSDELSYALTDGALHVGARVLDIGYVSTPQLAWAIREQKAVGGLMATASHNPGEYNGIKAVVRRGDGLELVGGHELRQIYDGHSHSYAHDGRIETKDIIPDYARAVMAASNWQGRELAISIDAPPPVRRALELIAPIAPDDGLAAKFDADGDRIVFYEFGRPVAADWIFVLLVEHLRLTPVIMDLRFSKAVKEKLAVSGIEYHESAVGRLAMTQNMQLMRAAFGGETSGHYYWRSFANMESPELTLLNVLYMIDKSGKNLSELVQPYEKYAKSQEINIPVKDRKAAKSILEHVAAVYASRGDMERLDGISADMWKTDGWWFNLRLSNTEPVMRLVAEAKNKELLAEKLKGLKEILGLAD